MTQNNAPRLLLAGTGSGCGKTTVTTAILRALQRRGVKLNAFKCGPDYIDRCSTRRFWAFRAAI